MAHKREGKRQRVGGSEKPSWCLLGRKEKRKKGEYKYII